MPIAPTGTNGNGDGSISDSSSSSSVNKTALRFLWRSERTGYQHIYGRHTISLLLTCWTSNAFKVMIQIDRRCNVAARFLFRVTSIRVFEFHTSLNATRFISLTSLCFTSPSFFLSRPLFSSAYETDTATDTNTDASGGGGSGGVGGSGKLSVCVTECVAITGGDYEVTALHGTQKAGGGVSEVRSVTVAM
jgi:hypothetical protein